MRDKSEAVYLISDLSIIEQEGFVVVNPERESTPRR
jgi:hypothetical protein